MSMLMSQTFERLISAVKQIVEEKNKEMQDEAVVSATMKKRKLNNDLQKRQEEVDFWVAMDKKRKRMSLSTLEELEAPVKVPEDAQLQRIKDELAAPAQEVELLNADEIAEKAVEVAEHLFDKFSEHAIDREVSHRILNVGVEAKKVAEALWKSPLVKVKLSRKTEFPIIRKIYVLNYIANFIASKYHEDDFGKFYDDEYEGETDSNDGGSVMDSSDEDDE